MEITSGYKTVLKNEVVVRRKEMNELFDDNNVYVLGYGSLLHSHGWYGRGMVHVPKPSDLIECTLKGFERGPYGLFDNWNFYGIIRNSKRECNAVIVPIVDLRDWANLMKTEHIAGLTSYINYRVVDVTNEVVNIADKERLKTPYRIHAVCNRPENRRTAHLTTPWPGYYSDVWAGVRRERTKVFIERFLETGGFKVGHEVYTFLKKKG